jgi:rod shape-determining protein MreD
MSEPVRIILWGFAVLLVQIGSGTFFDILGIRPDFILIYVLLTTLRHGRITGLLTGFGLGLLLDYLSIGTLGVHALAKSSLAFWVGMWLDNRVGSVALGWWVLILGGAFVIQGTIISFVSPLSQQLGYPGYFTRYILPGTIYTCLAGLLWAVAPMGTRSRGPLAPAYNRGPRSLR